MNFGGFNIEQGGDVELYIEYVLIDNLVVDYILLKFIERTMGIKLSKYRKCLFLLFGVLSALLLPYLYVCSLVVLSIYRIMVSVLMTICIKKYKKITTFFGYFGMLWAYTFFIGGVILGVLNLFNISYNSNSLILYQADVPIGVLGVALLILVCFMKKLIGYIKSKFKDLNYIYEVEIEDKNNVVRAQGFFDSGNSISCRGDGVNIISIGLFMKLYKDVDIAKVVSKHWDRLNLKNIETIYITGLGEKEKFLTFNVDKVTIKGKEYRNARFALVMKNFENYECVLHKDYVG